MGFPFMCFSEATGLFAFHEDAGFKNPQAREEGAALTCPPHGERDAASNTECPHESLGSAVNTAWDLTL